MDEAVHLKDEREAQWMQAIRDEFVARILRVVQQDGVIEPLPGLHLGRISTPLQKFHSVLEPSICVIAQGSKEVFLGDTPLSV